MQLFVTLTIRLKSPGMRTGFESIREDCTERPGSASFVTNRSVSKAAVQFFGDMICKWFVAVHQQLIDNIRMYTGVCVADPGLL